MIKILITSSTRRMANEFEKLQWHVPKLLDRLKYESKVKITEEQEVGAHSLARNIFEVEGSARASGWD